MTGNTFWKANFIGYDNQGQGSEKITGRYFELTPS